jgi:hypothetical protein
LNALFPGLLVIEKIVETHEEDWRVVAKYLKKMKEVTPSRIPIGNRIVASTSDLSILEHDIHWLTMEKHEGYANLDLELHVRNTGASDSTAGAKLRVLGNENGTNTALSAKHYDLVKPIKIPPLKAGESVTLHTKVQVKSEGNVYPVSAKIETVMEELNHGNNFATSWLTPESPGSSPHDH